jgi:hypothetical protein
MSDDSVLPAIVVVAFERAEALARLLRSLAAASYPKAGTTALVISLDGDASPAVCAEARRFQWEHGGARVIEHGSRLGLRRHVLACGDLSEEYGAVIVLEDDLFVSPAFYRYALQALAFYSDEPSISGVSLYAQDYNEYARLRFVPLDDGYDNHFIQSASSWGQMWSREQWRAFRAWEREGGGSVADGSRGTIPREVLAWPDTSWKKSFIAYMTQTQRYMVYPRTSLTTNFGEAGTHYLRRTGVLQVPLLLSGEGALEHRFSSLADSNAIYDSHFELEPDCVRRLAPALSGLDFECDFYGSKDPAAVRAEHLISVRECAKPERGYAFELVPAEANLLFDLRGDFFALAPRARFGETPLRKRALQFRHLHKNGGLKRYGLLTIEALRELL